MWPSSETDRIDVAMKPLLVAVYKSERGFEVGSETEGLED
jgi:hypothetical protein